MAAKRTVVRQETGSAVETPVPTEGQDGYQAPAAPAAPNAPEKKEVKPLDVTVAVNPGGTFVVRVWSGLILYMQGHAMVKTPCVPNKPIKIRITQ